MARCTSPVGGGEPRATTVTLIGEEVFVYGPGIPTAGDQGAAAIEKRWLGPWPVCLNPATGRPYSNAPGVLSMRLDRPDPDDQIFFGNLDDATRVC